MQQSLIKVIHPNRNIFSADFVMIVIGMLILAFLAFYSEPAWRFELFRQGLGMLYILYVPGYCLAAALFPFTNDLDGMERTALSLGLSLAVVPILALVLNQLPGGLRLWPILTSECAIILISLGVTGWRRIGLAEVYSKRSCVDWRPWVSWRNLLHSEKNFFLWIAGTLVVMGMATAWIFLVQSPGQFTTVFYILGHEGQADNYPYQAHRGEVLQITLGLQNQERTSQVYRIVGWVEDPWNPEKRKIIAEAGPFLLTSGQSLESLLTWRMPWSGNGQIVTFQLFHEPDTLPYRQLRLIVDIHD